MSEAGVEEEVDRVSWLLVRQCGLCQGLAQSGVSTPCCSSAACKPCAAKHILSNSCCWTCESPVEESQLLENKEISDSIEKIISSLFSCCICRETCHRAVSLDCCEGGAVCRGCGVKHVTTNRSCWNCAKPNIRSEDLNSDEILRDALNHHKDNGEHSPEGLNKLFLRRIAFLKENLKRKDEESEKAENHAVNGNDKDSESNLGNEEENGEIKEKEKSPTPEKRGTKRERSDSRERRRDKKKKHKDDQRRDEKKKRKHRSRDRDRSRERRRSRDRDRSRDRNKGKGKEDETNDVDEKKEPKKENGTGSFAALQKRIRIENEIVEKRVKEKIEEHISLMVTQQLRVKKNEIEREVLAKVDLARQNMEEEVKLEIDLMRKLREGEEKKRMDEMNARMAEKEKALENERKKLAEDRLAILENQMRIEKEKQKEKKKLEKKSKQEQMKILGKDKSRPRLSFSLMKN